MNSFPRQSRSRGGGIATVYKSILASNITFKSNFDVIHASFEIVQASITLQHNTLHFFLRLYRPPSNRRNNLTDSMFTKQVPDFLGYMNDLPGFASLDGDRNMHFENPLQSQTKQTFTTLSIYYLVRVINKSTHKCVISYYHHIGMQYHNIVMSCHIILSQCHHVMSCHIIVISSYHIIIMSSYHIILTSYRHSMSYHIIVVTCNIILSSHHVISYHHQIVISCHIILSSYHVIS